MGINYPFVNVLPPDYFTAPRGSPNAWGVGDILGFMMTSLSQGIQQRQALAQYNFRNAWDVFSNLPEQMKPQVYGKLVPIAKAAGIELPADYQGGPATIGDIWTQRGQEIPEQYKPYANVPYAQFNVVEADLREKETITQRETEAAERTREWEVGQKEIADEKTHQENLDVLKLFFGFAAKNPNILKSPAMLNQWTKTFPDISPYAPGGPQSDTPGQGIDYTPGFKRGPVEREPAAPGMPNAPQEGQERVPWWQTAQKYATMKDYYEDVDPGYLSTLMALPPSAGVASMLATPYPTDPAKAAALDKQIHAMFRLKMMDPLAQGNEFARGQRMLEGATIAGPATVAKAQQELLGAGWTQTEVDAATGLASRYDMRTVTVADMSVTVPAKDVPKTYEELNRLVDQRQRYRDSPGRAILQKDLETFNKLRADASGLTGAANALKKVYQDWYADYANRAVVKNHPELKARAPLAFQSEHPAEAKEMDRLATQGPIAEGKLKEWTRIYNEDIAKYGQPSAPPTPDTTQQQQGFTPQTQAAAKQIYDRSRGQSRQDILFSIQSHWAEWARNANLPRLQEAVTQMFNLTPEELQQVKSGRAGAPPPPPPGGRGREQVAPPITGVTPGSPEDVLRRISAPRGGSTSPATELSGRVYGALSGWLQGVAGRIRGRIREDALNEYIDPGQTMTIRQLVPDWKRWSPAERDRFRRSVNLPPSVVQLLNSAAGVR